MGESFVREKLGIALLSELNAAREREGKSFFLR